VAGKGKENRRKERRWKRGKGKEEKQKRWKEKGEACPPHKIIRHCPKL